MKAGPACSLSVNRGLRVGAADDRLTAEAQERSAAAAAATNEETHRIIFHLHAVK